MKIAICAPDIFNGDAVGNHCFGIARTARQLGYDVRLYAQRYDTGRQPVHPIDRLFDETADRLEPDDVLLLSYSIFDPYLDRLLALRCHKVCYFHGVTTPALLATFEPRTAALCAASYEQFGQLAHFDMMLCNSVSSARSLAEWAHSRAVMIMPPVNDDMAVFRGAAARRVAPPVRPRLLMVGRVVPHKRIEDGIDVLAALHGQGVPAVLSIVGSLPNQTYWRYLINHARALGVLAHIDFAGTVDEEELFDEYASASVLLTLSQHEGFCVPVLEALCFGKPVYVRAGTAAEELCTPDQVLPVDAPAAEWARRLIEDGVLTLSHQRGGLPDAAACAEQAQARATASARFQTQAQALLTGCGAAAWASIFDAIGKAHPTGGERQ